MKHIQKIGRLCPLTAPKYGLVYNALKRHLLESSDWCQGCAFTSALGSHTILNLAREMKFSCKIWLFTDVESSRMSLASRTHFEVLGLLKTHFEVLSLRTALFFDLLKFPGAPEKFFGRCFFRRSFFFVEHLRLCPWTRAFLSLASRGSVLGRAVLGLGTFFVSLASSLVSSTPPLVIHRKMWLKWAKYSKK